MDKFIKSVPIIVTVGLLAVILVRGDAEYSNMAASILCASVVIMLTGLVYIILSHFKQRLMPPGYYLGVMFAAGLITFAVLYMSLEYFYS